MLAIWGCRPKERTWAERVAATAMKDAFRDLVHLLPIDFRRPLGLLAILNACASVLEAAGLALVFLVLSSAATPESDNRWFAALQDHLGSRERAIAILAVFVLPIYACKIALSLLSTSRCLQLQWRLQAKLARRLLGRYLEADYSYHLNNNSAQLLHNVTSGVSNVTGRGFVTLVEILGALAMLTAIMITLLVLSPVVTLIAFSALAVSALVYWRTTSPILERLGRQYNLTAAAYYKAVGEALSGVKIIKVLAREEQFASKFEASIRATARPQTTLSMLGLLPRTILELLVVCGLLGATAIPLLLGLSARSSIPLLLLFAMAAFRMMPLVAQISRGLQNIRYASDSIATVAREIERLPSIAPDQTVDLQPTRLKRAIELSGVTLQYEGADHSALSDVDAVFECGRFHAIVGPSGAGKTSLADLILGLLTPSHGQIQFDDQPVSCIPSNQRTRLVGYVPQDPFLLDASIADNVALGRTNGVIDISAIRKAIASASLDTFIDTLPEGLNTLIGECGTRLSGGQRQRIGIARALYGNPDVLVLDEATSSVDATTQADIMRSLKDLRKTLIVIAHQLSTVQMADQILYIEEGRATDSGTFADLLRRSSSFARMVQQMTPPSGTS